MADSAFGVTHAEISKLGPPKVKYQDIDHLESEGKNGDVKRHRADTATTAYRGKSLILRRPKYDALSQPNPNSIGADRKITGGMATPPHRVRGQNAKNVASAFEGKKKNVTIKGKTFKHYREGDTIKKSAFDVEHEVEKGMFSMPGAFRAAATSAAQKPMAAAGKLKPKPGGTFAGMAQNAKPFAQQNKKAIAGGAAAGGAGAGAMGMKNKMNKPKPPTNRV